MPTTLSFGGLWAPPSGGTLCFPIPSPKQQRYTAVIYSRPKQVVSSLGMVEPGDTTYIAAYLSVIIFMQLHDALGKLTAASFWWHLLFLEATP